MRVRELRITQKGAILLSKTINSPLIFTNMALGSGVLESWDDSIEGMIAQVLKEAVSDVNVSNGQITFRTVFKNESLEIGFYVNEIGVFAQDPDEGEILFAYTNSFGKETDYMEKGTGSKIIKYIIDIAMAFTSDVEVQLLVDPSKNYISVDKIANDLDTDDPSKVLAASMGKKLKNPEFDDSGTVESISSFTDFINSVKNKMNIFQFYRDFKAGMKFILHTGMIVDNYATKEKGFLPDATLVTNLKEQLDEQNNNIDGIFLNKSRFKFITTNDIDTIKNDYFPSILNGYVNYYVITNSTVIIGYESGDNLRGNQITINYDGNIKRRYKDNGVWTSWVKFILNSDLEPIDLSDQIIMNNGWTKLLFRCIKVGKLLSITATIKSPTSLTGTYTPIFTFPSNIKMRNDMQRITLSLYDGVNIGEAFAVFYKEHNQLRIDNNYTFGYKTSTSYIFNCVVPIE